MADPLYWEDFTPGLEFSLPGRTVTDADLVLFSGLTGDHFPLHTNDLYAAQTRFGRRIAHGALVLSLSIGMITQGLPLAGSLIAFAGIDRLRFTAPVFPGDTLSLTKKILDSRPKGPGAGLVTFESTVRNQHGNVVLVYAAQFLFRSRNAPSPENPS